MGCILYELVTAGKKAFESDFNVFQYSFSRSKMQIPFVGVPESTKPRFSDFIHAMLQSNWSKRPSSTNLWGQFFQNRSIALGDGWLERVDYRQLKEYQNVYGSEVSPLNSHNFARAYYNIGDFNSLIAMYKNAIKKSFNLTPTFKAALRQARTSKLEKHISQCIKSIRTQACAAASDLRFICWMSHILVIVATSAFVVSWSQICFFDYRLDTWKYWSYRVANIGSVVSWGILSYLETDQANVENKWQGVTVFDYFGAPPSDPLTESTCSCVVRNTATKFEYISVLLGVTLLFVNHLSQLHPEPDCTATRHSINFIKTSSLTTDVQSRSFRSKVSSHVLLLFTAWGPGYIIAVCIAAWFQVPWSLLLLVVGAVLTSMTNSWPVLKIGTPPTGILLILKSLYTFYYYVLSRTPEPRPELAVILGMHSVNLLLIFPCLVLSVVGE